MDRSVKRPTWVPDADSGAELKKFFEEVKVKYQIKDLSELQKWSVENSDPVSYTHLTLPTILRV